MHDDQFKLEPEHQILVGLAVIVLTASVQAIVLFSNASFVWSSFGLTSLVIYLAAALCYMLMPWLAAHLPEFRHHHVTRLMLLGFCFWIGAEETLHASSAYATPEIAQAVASGFWSNENVSKGAHIIIVAALLAMIELLGHLQGHGIAVLRHGQKRRRRK